jgi:hypothetical protein
MAAILVPSLLFSLAPSAPAGPATHFSVRTENVTIPWAFPPPDGISSFCSEVPDGVHINPDDNGSDRVKNANQKTSPNGSIQVKTTDLVTGTAHDNFGAAYFFVYENNVNYVFDGSTVTVQMKDTFKLKGGNVNYTVGFNWKWAYLANSLEVIEVTDGNGATVDSVVDLFSQRMMALEEIPTLFRDHGSADH